MQLTAAEAAAVMGGEVHGDGSVLLTGAQVDSRRVGAGDLFVALPGARVDGHDYVVQALGRGAAALVRRGFQPAEIPAGTALIVVQEPLAAYHRLAAAEVRRHGWTVAAITGSVGKTTTKKFLAEVVGKRRVTGASQGNRNNTLGLPAEILSQIPGIEVFVAETGMSHRGELEILGRMLEPEVVLYTRIASAHTQFLGGLQGVIDAKAELLGHMPASGRLVINHDDPNQRSFPSRAVSGVQVVHYGRDAAEVRFEVLEERALRGCLARIVNPDDDIRVEFRLPGTHQLENLVAAAAGAWALGIDLNAVAEAVPELSAGPHRGEVVELGNGVTVVDDAYNASPLAVERMLELLAGTCGRKVAVLGGMFELGVESETEHRRIGGLAAESADLLLAVGAEHGSWLAEGARAAGMAPASVVVADDVEHAGRILVDLMAGGDIVLLKGSRGVGLERVLEFLRGAC